MELEWHFMETYEILTIPLLLQALAFSWYFLSLSIKFMTLKRPVLLSARNFFVVLNLSFVPYIFCPIIYLVLETPNTMFEYLLLFAPVVVGGCLWIGTWNSRGWKDAFKGYSVYGVSESTLLEALASTLETAGISSQEKRSGIYLASWDTTLRISCKSIGIVNVHAKEPGKEEVLLRIVAGLTECFSANNIKPKGSTVGFIVFAGLFMLCAAAVGFVGNFT